MVNWEILCHMNGLFFWDYISQDNLHRQFLSLGPVYNGPKIRVDNNRNSVTIQWIGETSDWRVKHEMCWDPPWWLYLMGTSTHHVTVSLRDGETRNKRINILVILLSWVEDPDKTHKSFNCVYFTYFDMDLVLFICYL